MQLEKNDENFSEIENSNNCNITMPSMIMNKIIKNLVMEVGAKVHLIYKIGKIIKKRKQTNLYLKNQ